MVAVVVGRLGQLLDGDVRARDVGVAEAQVNDVLLLPAGLVPKLVDDGEDVGGQPVDAPKLHSNLLKPSLRTSSNEATGRHRPASDHYRSVCCGAGGLGTPAPAVGASANRPAPIAPARS